MKKIAIVGSRGFPYEQQVRNIIHIEFSPGDILISGGASGPDKWGADEAKRLGYECIIFLPDWALGKGAGFARNTRIVDEADIIHAFWDGFSRGTLDTIQKGLIANKLVKIYLPVKTRE